MDPPIIDQFFSWYTPFFLIVQYTHEALAFYHKEGVIACNSGELQFSALAGFLFIDKLMHGREEKMDIKSKLPDVGVTIFTVRMRPPIFPYKDETLKEAAEKLCRI
jgi:hypothetical protein